MMKTGLKHFRVKKTVIAGSLIMALAVFTIFAYAAEPGSTADPIALKSYVDSRLEALEAKLTAGAQSPAQTASGSAGQAGAAGQVGATAQAGASAEIAALTDRISALENAIDLLREENGNLRQNAGQPAAQAGNNPAAPSGPAAATGVGVLYNEDDSYGEGESSDQAASSNRTVSSDQAALSGAVAATDLAAEFYADHFTAIEVLANRRIVLGAGAEMVLRTGKASAIRGELGALVDIVSGADLEAGGNIPVNHLIISSRDDSRGARISEDAWVLIKGPYEIR